MVRDTFHQTRLLKAPSNLALNTSREGASTTSLGNLFHCLTTLIVKNFFLLSKLNLPSFTFKSLPLVLSLPALVKKSISSFLASPLQVLKAAIRSAQNLLFSKLNNPSSLSLSSQERCSIPLLTFVALLWTHFNSSMSFLCWVLQSCTQDSRWGLSRAERENHQPWPAGHPSFDAARDTVGLLGCKHTLPGRVELLINQHSHFLLLSTALNPFSAKPVFVLGITQPMCRTLHCPFHWQRS